MKSNYRFNNEDKFRSAAEYALEAVNKEEALAWRKHPCTQALVAALQADMCGIVNTWLEGGYSEGQSVDATAQNSAKARGIAQSIDDVLEKVEQIGRLDKDDGEDYGY